MSYEIKQGDVIEQLHTIPEGSVHCCVTSPPYWGLRDYGVEGQIGLEESPEAYVEKMVEVLRGVWRALRGDGTLWLNIGDSYAGGGRAGKDGYAFGGMEAQNRCNAKVKWGQPTGKIAGLKHKDLCLIPYRLILALQQDGWWVRSQIVWAKKSSMPESVRDRPTSSWEPIFLLTKAQKYYYDAEAVRVPGKEWTGRSGTFDRSGNDVAEHVIPNQGYAEHRQREDRVTAGANLRNVWHLGPEPFPDAHFATFPTEIPRRAILAGTSQKGCCPECGGPWDYNDAEAALQRRRNAASGGVDKVTLGRTEDIRKATTGWQPTCECVQKDTSEPYEPVPCMVLDPFGGSCTTGLVAEQLGRDSVLIEINPEYAEMGERRIQAGLPLTSRKNNETGVFRLEPTG